MLSPTRSVRTTSSTAARSGHSCELSPRSWWMTASPRRSESPAQGAPLAQRCALACARPSRALCLTMGQEAWEEAVLGHRLRAEQERTDQQRQHRRRLHRDGCKEGLCESGLGRWSEQVGMPRRPAKAVAFGMPGPGPGWRRGPGADVGRVPQRHSARPTSSEGSPAQDREPLERPGH